MSISTRIIRYVTLALAVAAVVAPSAQAASGPASRDAAFRAAHWKHEDAIFEANRVDSVRPLSASLEAHWNHEDAQYNARIPSSGRPQSAAPAVEPGEGIDRLAVLTAAGSVAALLILGTAAVTGVRRKHRGVAQS
jgi:hypothetical protein